MAPRSTGSRRSWPCSIPAPPACRWSTSTTATVPPTRRVRSITSRRKLGERAATVMARIAYFDCPSGAAGDMIMAALVDAGAPVEALEAELAKLRLSGWRLGRREVRKGAFRATKVDVDIDHHVHRHHRGLGEILAILEASALAPAIK